MSAPTDRGLALARAFIANIDEWDGEPMPGQRWHKEYTAAKELIRAAEIDASKPDCPCGESTCIESWEPGCGLGSSAEHAKPIHAEAVEALPGKWRETAEGERKLIDTLKWSMTAERMEERAETREYCAMELETALAARHAAVGGDEPFCYAPSGMFDPRYAEQHFTVSRFRILPDAVPLYTQPQQLAVTDEAVLIACGIYAGEIGEVSNYAMRRALTAALPHVVRKGE